MSRPEIKTHRTFWGSIEGLPIIGVFIVLVGIFMITAPETFLGHRIYMTFLATVSPPLILGLGLTLVITAGEIDLSFPSVLKMSSLTFAYLVKFQVFPLDAGAARGDLVAEIGIALPRDGAVGDALDDRRGVADLDLA